MLSIRNRSAPCNSFFALYLSSAVWPDLVRASGKDPPELPAHQARDRRALVQAVILRHCLKHGEIARRGRKSADFGLLHRVGFVRYIIVFKSYYSSLDPVNHGVSYRGARLQHRQTRTGSAYGCEKESQAQAEGVGKKTGSP